MGLDLSSRHTDRWTFPIDGGTSATRRGRQVGSPANCELKKLTPGYQSPAAEGAVNSVGERWSTCGSHGSPSPRNNLCMYPTSNGGVAEVMTLGFYHRPPPIEFGLLFRPSVVTMRSDNLEFTVYGYDVSGYGQYAYRRMLWELEQEFGQGYPAATAIS
ncbi:hypothetical protein K458DRAFT_425963 [Lentithecium fluviatile CBS 122367]|uniref:Uncharacterized protein n=1 Tax=Lentithecium fluviatile CBS 122367 TaxID=1168545 RepID=A0A6G1JPX5_9PLEO|nr:hypothetical protein K458DRAFT_425963 [Lentithecium fluviatile CBS 122367]